MSNILIIYASRHGTCRKVAEMIRDCLSGLNVELLELQGNESVDISNYNNIIIGGSIHGGKIQDRIKKFCIKNIDDLFDKKVGLFLCSMKPGETATNQYMRAFPSALIEHAEVNSLCGGEFLFEKMHSFEKLIVKKFSGCTSTLSKIKEPEIEKFKIAFH